MVNLSDCLLFQQCFVDPCSSDGFKYERTSVYGERIRTCMDWFFEAAREVALEGSTFIALSRGKPSVDDK